MFETSKLVRAHDRDGLGWAIEEGDLTVGLETVSSSGSYCLELQGKEKPCPAQT